MKSLQQLKTDLEIYQEGVAEADNYRTRQYYEKLCHKTHAEIEAWKPPVTYNWKPVVGSLLSKLQKAGFTLVSVDNGGGKVKLEGTDRQKRQQAKAEICAVDEALVYVENSEGISKWIFLVLGNEPEETVNNCAVDPGLDAVLEEFSKQWEGKPCPKY